jgi:sterol desaturase/sphingolipid hydroxylase (fatty acid hydroxylase superfamily)
VNLNRILYFGDFFACPVAILALALAMVIEMDVAALGVWVLTFIAGCAAWTLVEYAVHRWIYHRLALFERLHDAHHINPTGMIGAPSFVSIALIFAVFYLPLFLVSGDAAGGLTSGLLLGYFLYGLVHHAAHHWTLKPGSRLYRLRLQHMAHHHRDNEGNYGVITPFWDHVFGTWIEPRRR